MDATQITVLERQMLEEHKKDIEALARLKRFLPTNGAAPDPVEHRQMALPVGGDAEELDDAPVTTLRGKIEEIINADPTQKWTTQRVLARLREIGFPLNAQKPIYSVGQSLKILAGHERIKLVRKGVGSAPNIYRARVTEQQANSMEVPSADENDRGLPQK